MAHGEPPDPLQALYFKTPEVEQKYLQLYWGLYCPQHDCWYQKKDGELFYYPHPAIARAHLSNDFTGIHPLNHNFTSHKWEVTEFGTERYTPEDELPIGTILCPVVYNRFN